MKFARYDLNYEELSSLTHDLLTTHPLSENPKPYGVYLLEGNSQYANLGRTVERNVFLSKFGNTAAQLQEEYAPYEGNSLFLTVIDQLGTNSSTPLPTGIIRVISHNPQIMPKSISDIDKIWGSQTTKTLWKELAIQTDYQTEEMLKRTWDVATMAVDTAYRGARGKMTTALILYYTLYSLSVSRKIDYWVGILADDVLTYLNRIGLDLRAIGPSREYLGWPDNTPFTARVGDMLEGMVRNRRYFLARVTITGETLSESCDFPKEIRPQT
jgi:hypothetical protein